MIHAADVTDSVDSLWGAVFGGSTGFIMLAVYVLVVVALWKVFTKAGYPGILAIIPIVNTIFLVKIAGYSGWMALLYLIPIVNIVFAIIVAVKLGARFGKGGAFSFFLLWLLPFIGYFIIGFGDAKYSRA
ncbi:DUF5684 domain-containing protein [Microbacterium sp. KUDC0406]|uniref:DUF5684 domain-containing protein n=1 Tax=Microbacterium sp. KUDC0406 TaxID=2909588 RepID=UPI001F211A06|nr:DUF5684 domain-containing protein [Microbacterium sp. KUDC0406]UJP08994.1 DUF5684 domain-containing protein [Microbacterium sp. KUDC0406]